MGLRRIVVGVDFSPASLEAARWTARHLGRDAEVVLAHVVAIPEPPPIMRGRFPQRDLLIDTVRAGADRRLRELGDALPSERVWLEIREGDVTTTLSAIAREFAAELLVIGVHEDRPDHVRTLGSTAQQLVDVADMPVLVVGGNTSIAPARILVPLDRSATAQAALCWAEVMRERLDAEVVMLHVVPPGVMSRAMAAVALASGTLVPDPIDHRLEATSSDEWLALATSAGIPRSRLTSEVAFGEAFPEILASARRLGAGLVVMGRRGAGGVRRAVLGSVVAAVLRDPPCPVLVVPDRDRGPAA